MLETEDIPESYPFVSGKPNEQSDDRQAANQSSNRPPNAEGEMIAAETRMALKMIKINENSFLFFVFVSFLDDWAKS